MTTNKIIKLDDYFDLNDILELKENFKEIKPNGKAILIGQGTEIEISKELLINANDSIRSATKRLKINKNTDIENPIGKIDDNSRDFIIKYTSMNEWLFNSTSFSSEHFTGLKEFDKAEMKEKLLRLASML